MQVRSLIFTVTGIALGLIACSSGATSTEIVSKSPVASVSLTLPLPSLMAGETQRAVAIPRDASGAPLSDRAVTWQSASPSVATIDNSGMILAVAAGTDVVTATSEGVSAQSTLTVMAVPPVPVASVSVSPATPTVQIGATAQLTAVTRDANNNVLSGRVVTWASANSGVASVSPSGLLAGVSAGASNIIATSEGVNGQTAATVTVTAPVPVASVSVSPAAPSVQVGTTVQLTAVTLDANNNVLSGRVVTWTSANSGTASVSSTGLITGVSAGTTSITATSEGKTASASVTVTLAPVASVTVSLPNGTLAVGASVQATATLRDANNNVLTGRTVTWATGNIAFATVSTSGLVLGVAAGNTTVNATSGGVSGSANLTVVPVSVGTVFSDDFEAGTFAKWDESNSAVQQIINDPASAHSGNRFLRLTYGINGQDAGWLNKYFYQGYTQLYVRYYARFSSNFTGITKLVGFHGAPIGNPTFGVGRAGICPNGTDSFASLLVEDYGDAHPTKMYTYWEDMWADTNGQCWGRYGPTPSTWPYASMPELARGVWHKIEYTIKLNSAPNVADGAQRFWVDGVLYGEWTGIRFGDPALINIGVLQISGSGTTTQLQTIDYDDLILTTDFPTVSQP
jgi:uncharacterized protein YjdB